MPRANPNIDPRFYTPAEALTQARRLANEAGAAYTIVAEVNDHKLVFYPLLSESYAAIREKGLADNMAPVASVTPQGVADIYSPLKGVWHV